MTGTVILIAIVAVILLGTRDKLLSLFGISKGSGDRKTARQASRADFGWRDMVSPSQLSVPEWLGYGDVLYVKGVEITHPMTYVSSADGSKRMRREGIA